MGSTETEALKYAKACHFEKGQLFFNTTVLQTHDMTSCGAFCITFIVNRLENPDLSLGDLCDQVFSGNPIADEKMSIQFVEDLNK